MPLRDSNARIRTNNESEKSNLEQSDVQRPQPKGGVFTRSLLESKWREGEAAINRIAKESQDLVQIIRDKKKKNPAIGGLRWGKPEQLDKQLEKLEKSIKTAQEQAL